MEINSFNTFLSGIAEVSSVLKLILCSTVSTQQEKIRTSEIYKRNFTRFGNRNYLLSGNLIQLRTKETFIRT